MNSCLGETDGPDSSDSRERWGLCAEASRYFHSPGCWSRSSCRRSASGEAYARGGMVLNGAMTPKATPHGAPASEGTPCASSHSSIGPLSSKSAWRREGSCPPSRSPCLARTSAQPPGPGSTCSGRLTASGSKGCSASPSQSSSGSPTASRCSSQAWNRARPRAPSPPSSSASTLLPRRGRGWTRSLFASTWIRTSSAHPTSASAGSPGLPLRGKSPPS